MATSYTKTNWQDAPSASTPITAAQLNRMEKGIEDCSGQGNANELAIAANAEAIRTLESGIQLGSISITDLLLLAYPVGSIYSSTASTSPQELFGGTWERIKGKFIWGVDDGETAGTTGGEVTHTLTVDEMPNHQHLLPVNVNESEHTENIDIFSYGGWKAQYNYSATAFSGGNQPHNNMPPYYGAYIWRRTA